MNISRSVQEGFPLPTALDPTISDTMLPELEPKDLTFLKQGGWARLGIVAAVLDERQRVLMLRHKPSDKTPAGALGPLAETGQVARSRGGTIMVEPTALTLSRGIHEELGVRNPSGLQLTAKRTGAWALNKWPVGIQYKQQFAMAVCPVVHLGASSREWLMDTFRETEEIDGIDFMPYDEILHAGLVRPGTREWLGAIAASGLATSHAGRELVRLPDPRPLPGAVDVKFGQLDYL